MLPWARCKLFSIRTGVPMLATQWTQLRIGPILRGEPDWRSYHNLFRAAPEDIRGLRRAWALKTSAKVPESSADSAVQGGGLVCFEDMANWFGSVAGHSVVIRRELDKIILPKWKNAANETAAEPIGLHVRMGDFSAAPKADRLNQGNTRTPLPWFVRSLERIRKEAGMVPAFIVSDGKDHELKELLDVPNVRLVRTGSALSDMLFLSRCKVLLASGGSSFSYWASFLGQIPALSIPGCDPTPFQVRLDNGAFVGEFHPDEPPAQFAQVLAALR